MAAEGYLKSTSKRMGNDQAQWSKLGAPVRNPKLMARVSKIRSGARKGAR